ncbi:hypothetical protein N7533_011304 [Penicillium manginii]|uniref:uncharacterized protein n=1 Tax=Penicillium manginii TaxID=203109 RepID=UPI0025473CA5|nr:uncharacterized protein N7533_011304 [Penicillium manginii]KAJ5741895.1 hypothetical protein N7533_011304 [Penicillium manginii]
MENTTSEPPPEKDATAPDDNQESTTQYVTGVKLVAIISAVTLVYFLILLDMSIIVTAIPRITTHFHSLADVGWYGSSYQLASASLQPLAGKVYSNFSAKITFLCFFAVFEFGSLLCAVSVSSKMLIISRAVAGIGSAGLINAAFGIMMGFGQLGIIIGPLLGGAFTEYVSWRWCFYINLPVGALVAALLVFTRIPAAVKPRDVTIWVAIKKRFDLIGFALLLPACVMFFLALDYAGHQFEWNSPTIIGLFCGAGVTFILFVVWEFTMGGEEAMVPYSMIRIRAVWSSCLVMLFFFGMLELASYYMPIYFQSVNNATPLLSGVYMLPSIISQLISTVVGGALVSRVGYYLPFIIISGALSSIGNGLMGTLNAHSSAGHWIGYQVLLGFGRGLGFQIAVIAVQSSLSAELVPVSMALISFSQTLGGAIFLAMGETLLTNSLKSNLPKLAPEVDPNAVVDAGATAIRDVVKDPVQLEGVIESYAKAVNVIFYVAAGSAALVVFLSWGMGWKDIRKKEDSPRETEQSAPSPSVA